MSTGSTNLALRLFLPSGVHLALPTFPSLTGKSQFIWDELTHEDFSFTNLAPEPLLHPLLNGDFTLFFENRNCISFRLVVVKKLNMEGIHSCVTYWLTAYFTSLQSNISIIHLEIEKSISNAKTTWKANYIVT